MTDALNHRVCWRLRSFASAADVSISTMRRRMIDDPSFPRTFRFSANGDLFVLKADAVAWIEAKAGVAAPVPPTQVTEPNKAASAQDDEAVQLCSSPAAQAQDTAPRSDRRSFRRSTRAAA